VIPVIEAEATPGSSTVRGRARPTLGPDCLRVYEVGANGLAEAGLGDDELLGMGTTGATGNFTITLNRPLADGDAIYVLDVCPPFGTLSPLVGPILLVVAPAPAPALSAHGTAAAFAALLIVAVIALARQRHRA
jgi:hypothetical protein